MKRPAFQFYPGDWQRDTALRACSVGARGLWIEMMCVMHQAEPYGYLVLNGAAIEPAPLGRLIGATTAEIRRWMGELEGAGVFSRDERGVFSRRMVKDERFRDMRANCGKLGGNPVLVGSKDNQNDDAAKNKVKVNPTPSSSVFSLQSSTSKAKSKAARDAGASAPGFDELWQAYPKRAGNDPKKRAERCYRARLSDGHTPQEMLNGASRYANFCAVTSKAGTELVLQAATFLGPDKPFLQAWTTGNGAGERSAAAAWWTSEAATNAKANELGMRARGNESWHDFRGRISAKLAENDAAN